MSECCPWNHGGSNIVLQEVCEESHKAAVQDQSVQFMRANKVVKGKQVAICFHIGDCKISHKFSAFIDNTVAWLRVEYEIIFEDSLGQMKVHRGKTHRYLDILLEIVTK